MIKGELFSQQFIPKLIDGTKVRTSRPIKPQPDGNVIGAFESDPLGNFSYQIDNRYLDGWRSAKPKYQSGDIIYVRETWTCIRDIETGCCDYFYAANQKDYDTISSTYLCDDDGFDTGKPFPWKPSIHMPKSIARIFLRVINVRVQNINDMTEQDAIEDGFEVDSGGYTIDEVRFALDKFKQFWKQKYGSDQHWMWVYYFERCDNPELLGGDTP